MWLQLQKTKRRGELAKCDLYFLFYEKHLTVFHNFLALLGRQKVLLLKTCLVKQCNVPLLETTYLNDFGHGSHLRQATNKLGKKKGKKYLDSSCISQNYHYQANGTLLQLQLMMHNTH